MMDNRSIYVSRKSQCARMSHSLELTLPLVTVGGFRFDKRNDRGIAVHLENETHSRLCFQSIGNIVEIKREIRWISLNIVEIMKSCMVYGDFDGQIISKTSN